MAQRVKHLPAVWETQVQSLGQEDRLEKEMANRSSILVLKIPWMEEPGRLGSGTWDRKESDTTERLHFHFSLSCIGEGNGNPLQCSCLEKTGDGSLVGFCLWASVYKDCTESDTTEAT